jgi:hypothetical protein
MRKFIAGLAIFVAVVVVAIGIAIFYSANVVQRIVEHVGSNVTGVSVTLREVDMSDVMDGTVAAHALRVGNPRGFNSEYAVDVPFVSATIDAGSIRADILVIREIVVDGAHMIYEYRQRSSNVGEIQRNVDAFLAERRPVDPPPEEGRPMLVENLIIRNAAATVMAPDLGRDAEVVIPPIHLQNLGTDGAGITPAELVARVFAELHRQLAGAVATAGLPDVSAHADRARRAADSAIEDVRDRTRDAARDVREEIEGRADEALRGIGDRVRGRGE